jgi:hypothetical protein
MESIDTTAAFRAAAKTRDGVAGSVLARSLDAAVRGLRVVPSEVSAAQRAVEISVEVADVIGVNLGVPNSAVTCERLGVLAGELCAAARVRPDGTAGLDVDHLVRVTRPRREELDLESVRLREDEQYAARG